MAVFKAAGSGIGTASRRSRLLLILWIINVLFALLIAGPFFALFSSDLGHSLLGRNLQTLDFIWLGDLVFRYQNMAPAALAAVAIPVVLYALVYVFLNGGIIGRLLDREGRTTPQTFFSDCGRYFWRFVRLFLVSLLFYALAFGVILEALSALLKPVSEKALTEWPDFWISGLHSVAALLCLSLVHMVFDYARILVVAEDDRRVLHALMTALQFVGKRFFRAWFLYLLIAAGSVAGTVVYVVVGQAIPPEGLAWTGIGILWGQVFIAFRLWTKMVFFSGQAEYVRITPY
ncbi:MAG: hypothetical protein ACXVI6_06825 [Candidatus Aminicenantales bacterium]